MSLTMRLHERLGMYLERLGPYFGGLVAFACTAIWHSQLAQWLQMVGIVQREAINATFNIMVTLTAFLFSVFVLAIAPGGGFIERIFNTKTFGIFKRYVVEALTLGAISATLCLPFIITPLQTGAAWKGYLLEAFWFGFSVAAVLSFVRVVHIFMVWVSFDSKQRSRSVSH